MLKVVFRQISRSVTKVIKVKNNQAYHLTEANEHFKNIIEASETYREEKGSYLKIGLDLVDDNSIQHFSANDVSVDGSFSTIDKLIEYLLRTDDKSRDNYDNGMSDYDEEARAIIEQLKSVSEITSASNENNVKTTNKSFNRFKKIFRGQNKKINDQSKEVILANTEESQQDIVDEETLTYEKEVEESKSISEMPIQETIQDQSAEDIEVPAENRENEIPSFKSSDEPPQAVETEAPVVEEQSEEPEEASEVKVSKTTNISIPKFELVYPQFKKSELDDIVSKDVQEWLNIKEYERVNLTNQAITDINESIHNFYLKQKTEHDEALIKYQTEHSDYSEILDGYKQDLMADDQSVLENYYKEKESYYNNLNSNKETEINNDIEAYRQRKASELEKYKLENEQSHNADVEEKRVSLRQAYDNNMSAKKSELDKKFQNSKNSYQKELDQNLKDSVQKLYQKHKGASYSNVVEFNNQVSQQLEQVRQIAKEYRLNIEREQTKQQELRVEERRLLDKASEKEKTENELKLINAQNEKLIQEKEKLDRDDRQRRLALEEQKQKDDHEAKMREIELKYKQKVAHESSNVDQNPSENKVNKNKLLSILGLIILIPLMLWFVSTMFQNANADTYDNYVEEENYEAIADEYPKQVEELSQELLTTNDPEALSELIEYTESPAVALRYHLASRNYQEALNTMESIDDMNVLTDEELNTIAGIYINERNYENAIEINRVLQNPEINRQLAESTYYEQYKEELESVIANSEDEDEVDNAEKELEQVRIILNDKGE